MRAGGAAAKSHSWGMPGCSPNTPLIGCAAIMIRSRSFSRYRRFGFWAAIVVIVLVVTAGVGLLIVNTVVLPDLIAGLQHRVEADYGITTSVERVRYVPFRGVQLLGVGAETSGPGVGVVGRVRRLRIRVPLSVVRAFGTFGGLPSLSAQDLRPWNAVDQVVTAIASFASAGLVPRSALLEDTSLLIRANPEDAVSISVSEIKMRREREAPIVVVYFGGSPVDTASGRVEVNYATETVDGNLELLFRPVSVHPMFAGSVRSSLGFRTADGQRVSIDGEVLVTDGALTAPWLAEEPVRGLDIHYEFSMFVDLRVSPTGTARASGARASGAASAEPDVRKADVREELGTGPNDGEMPFQRDAFQLDAAFTAGRLTVNDIRMTVMPSVEGVFGEAGVARVLIDLPKTPVDRILSAVPSAIAGPISEADVTGTLEWSLDLKVPLNVISDMVWDANTELTGFAVEAVPSSVNVFKLNGPFIHSIRDGDLGFRRTVRIPAARPASMEWMLAHSEHTERQIRRIRAQDALIASDRPPVSVKPDQDGRDASGGSGEDQNDLMDELVSAAQPEPDPEYVYVYVDDMSPWVIRAVLTAEDGDFFFYGGINWVTLADAVEKNLEAGEVLVGASTLSMQVVKMLFLDQQRILSRKLQEAFLVYLMEHQVPVSKERILELYLNLAEFGPGVFGIHDAARYYFNKHPRDLDVGEATWLASILPAPKRYHSYFENRWISDGWFIRMVSLYDIMLERGRMTPEQYADAVRRRPTFVPGG